MSWFDRFRPTSRKSIDNSLDLFRELYGGRLTKSGKVVNYKTAVEVSAVLACARVIAEGIAQVPLKMFQDTGTSKTPAVDHPLYQLLHMKPNGYQTSFEFFETLVLHLVLAGNSYCFKNVIRGQIRELLPLDPGTVAVRRAPDWSITYEVTIAGKTETFTTDQIWHVKGPSWATWLGLDATYIARDAIGLAIATEESHASLHKNGIQTTGTYSIEGNLDDKQYEQITRWIKKHNQGSDNAGTPLIMDRNAKWLSTVMSGVDAQHLETRKYQVEDICRHFRVMPIMVGYSDKATTYASSEQMFLAHVVHTLSPWYRRIEQSIAVNLLSEKDRAAGFYPKFIEQGLLRGSLQATKDYLVGLVQIGLMTRNEGREALELNRLDGLDEPLTPVNLGVGADPQPDPAATPDALPAGA
jgi:HK97 family phage portal protein